MSDIEEAGDQDVFRKVAADFDAAGVDQSEHQIRRTMDELMVDGDRADQEQLIADCAGPTNRPPCGRFLFARPMPSG